MQIFTLLLLWWDAHCIPELNSMVQWVQATFLAAVEAQLLGYSYQNNNTTVEIAINLFGFVGLALDVLGAAAGLTTHISGQEVDYELLRGMQSRVHELQSSLEEKEHQVRHLSSSILPPSVQDLHEFVRDDTGISWRNESKSYLTMPVPLPSGIPPNTELKILQEQCTVLGKQVRDARKRLFLNMLLALKNDIHRVVCIELMKFGIQSFFLSLILLVTHTQPKIVWISVITVITIGMMASPIGRALGLVERAVLQGMDKKAADRVIWLDDVDDSVFDAAEAREQRVLEKRKNKDYHDIS